MYKHFNWARQAESRVHLKAPDAPLPRLGRTRASLLAIQAQRLLLTIYRQGREPAVFLDLHSFLAVLDDSGGGNASRSEHGRAHARVFQRSHLPRHTRNRGRRGRGAQRSPARRRQSRLGARLPTDVPRLRHGTAEGETCRRASLRRQRLPVYRSQRQQDVPHVTTAP